MAKGMLGGILGDEEEKPDVEAPEALASRRGIRRAVAAIARGRIPESLEDGGVPQRQTQLRRCRGASEDEHAGKASYLQAKQRGSTIRRFGLAFRVGFQLFIALVRNHQSASAPRS